MAAIFAHHALGRPRRPRGVEDIERIAGQERHGRRDRIVRSLGPQRRPIDIVRRRKIGFEPITLEEHDMIDLVAGERERLVDHRLIGDGALPLDPARGGEQQARGGIIDPLGEFERGETAKHDRMDRPQPRAGEHGKDRFGDHRHVEDDAVALDHAQPRQHRGDAANLFQKLGIAELPDRIGDRAVIDQRGRVSAPGMDVAIKTIVTGVERRARKPAAHLGIAAGGRREPVDRLSGLCPEGFRIGDAATPCRFIRFAHRHLILIK